MKDSLQKIVSWIPPLLEGTRLTVFLTILSVSAGLVLAVFLALGKISKNKILNKICSFYIFFFRGTPLLLQLYFVWYGLPQISSRLTISDRFLAAFITFSINSSAYLAEVVRAAIVSIDKGQIEASRSLGLNYFQTMFTVIIPQAVARLLPPVSNEFILVLKDASLVSIIALKDITKVTQNIASSSASSLVFIPAMIIYLIITAFFTWTFKKLEKKALKNC
ncbi:MAG: amino acid ABC transporter permease [Treponema sp.]|uniref:amino acid ABC transporter permease n=1 Tax=Treponema sp. TaxID=166 RepID=UPI00298D71DB|nr:amino acid ABC transporter permease [Treponema sp.]MCR5385984.1 amino acid ABC transporter permease [Treponema sp.]